MLSHPWLGLTAWAMVSPTLMSLHMGCSGDQGIIVGKVALLSLAEAVAERPSHELSQQPLVSLGGSWVRLSCMTVHLASHSTNLIVCLFFL
jgi:hypothetical protein